VGFLVVVDAGLGDGGERGDEIVGAVVGLLLGISAELDEEEAAAFREERDVVEGFLLESESVEQEAVDALEADGLVGKDQRDVVGGDEDVLEADSDEGAELR